MKSTPSAQETAARQALALADVAGALVALDGVRHFNAHGDDACLCARCVVATGAVSVVEGVRFVLDVVVADGRALFFWAPASSDDRDRIAARLRRRLAVHLRTPRQNPQRRLRFSRWSLDHAR